MTAPVSTHRQRFAPGDTVTTSDPITSRMTWGIGRVIAVTDTIWHLWRDPVHESEASYRVRFPGRAGSGPIEAPFRDGELVGADPALYHDRYSTRGTV